MGLLGAKFFRIYLFLTVISVTAFVNSQALGSEAYFENEITGGVNATAGFARIYFGTYNYIQYSLTGSYSRSLSRRFQIGFQIAAANSGSVTDTFRSSLLIPLTYNWGGEDLRNDYFIRFSPGISYTYSVDGTLLLQFGKRFRLLENFSWRPTVGLNFGFGNGALRSAIDIIPVVFSVIF